MTVKHSSVSVGTTAVSLLGGITDDSRQNDRSALFSNEGSAPVYIGASDVTTTSYGYQLAAGGELALDIPTGNDLYAIAASGTVTVRVLHLGV